MGNSVYIVSISDTYDGEKDNKIYVYARYGDAEKRFFSEVARTKEWLDKSTSKNMYTIDENYTKGWQQSFALYKTGYYNEDNKSVELIRQSIL